MKRNNETTDDLKKLQRVGFSLHELEDSEYGSQPDSGSRASGIVGKDEYGIGNSIDADQTLDKDLSIESLNGEDADDLQNEGFLPIESSVENSEGTSQYSAAHSNTEPRERTEAAKNPTEQFSYAVQLLKKRIACSPSLKGERIEIGSEHNKIIKLRGSVHTIANRESARELAESIAIGFEVEDELSVVNS